MSFYRLAERQRVPPVGAPGPRRWPARSTLPFSCWAHRHVRHTVPLMAAGEFMSRPRLNWMQRDMIHYLGEEVTALDPGRHPRGRRRRGAVAGMTVTSGRGRPDRLRLRHRPAANPVRRILTMVFVLEGTSVALALNAAGRIQAALACRMRHSPCAVTGTSTERVVDVRAFFDILSDAPATGRRGPHAAGFAATRPG